MAEADSSKERRDLTAEINELLKQQEAIVSKISAAMRSQVNLAQQMMATASKSSEEVKKQAESTLDFTSALSDASEELGDFSTQSEKTNESLGALLEAWDDNSDSTSMFGKELGKTGKSLKEMSKAIPFAAGFLEGFSQQMTNTFAIIKMGVSSFFTLASAIVNIGTSILTLPLKVLGGLVEMAQSMGGDTAFAQARENIRKEFGSFSEDISKNIRATYKSLRGELASTGLSTYRILGNMAERLEYVHKLAQGMGNMFHIFGEEVAKSGEVIIAYQKGLGISEEQMKTVGLEAKVAGISLEKQLNTMAKASLGMAAKFGMSHKVISRDMAEMMEDTAHYTSLSAHEMSRASVYVRKLGLEIKQVAGILDKFDNFNDAAEGAANLAQAFGLNVDALEMMREQSPDKRIDMIRKSMFAAGQDAATMTRQELNLLAAQTGLDATTAKLAFSMKNQGVSMADLEKQQKKNEKKTLTQEEAMSKLADSIERLIKSGSTMQGGFFKMFITGFGTGLKRSWEFRRMLWDIRRSLRIVYWAGRRLGRIFVEAFPGVKQMIGGMRDFFAPERFRTLMGKVLGLFRGFFKDLTENPKMALPKLLEKIRETFMNFFGGGSGAGAKILGGLKSFGDAIMNIFASVVRIGIETLTGLFTGIVDLMTGKNKLPSVDTSGVLPTAMKFLQPLIDVFQDKKLMSAFGDSIMNLLGMAFDWVLSKASELASKYWPYIIGWLFGPALLKGLIYTAATKLTGTLLSGLGSILTGTGGLFAQGATKIFGSVGKMLSGGWSKAVGKMGPSMLKGVTKLAKFAGPIGLAIGAALGVSSGMDKFYDKLDPKFDMIDRKVGAGVAGLVDTFTLGLLPDSWGLAIAEAVTVAFDSFNQTMESLFGKNFADTLQKQFGFVFDTFDAIGDLLGAIFEGDSDKIGKAVMQLLESVAMSAINGMKFIFVDGLAALGQLIFTGISMIASTIVTVVKGIFSGIVDTLGAGIEALFGKRAREWWDYFVNPLKQAFDDIKAIVMWIPQSISDAIGAAAGLANSLWQGITGEISWEKVKEHFLGVANAALEAVTGMGQKIKDRIWGEKIDQKAVSDLQKRIMDGINNPKAARQTYLQGGGIFGNLAAGMEAAADRKQNWKFLEKTGLKYGKQALAVLGEITKNNSFAQEAERMKAEGLSLEDMSLYDKVKKMNPEKVKSVIDRFRNQIVPLFVGPNGLMATVRSLAESVTQEDENAMGKFSLFTGITERIAAFSKGVMLIATHASKIKVQDIEKAKPNLEKAVDSLNALAKSLATKAQSSGIDASTFENKLPTADYFDGITKTLSSIDTLNTKITRLNERSYMGGGKDGLIDPEKTPLVVGIQRMVAIANASNTALANLTDTSPINAKLQAVAEGLGLNGGKFKIKNDGKVNVEVTLNVKIDSKELSKELVKKTQYVAGGVNSDKLS